MELKPQIAAAMIIIDQKLGNGGEIGHASLIGFIGKRLSTEDMTPSTICGAEIIESISTERWYMPLKVPAIIINGQTIVHTISIPFRLPRYKIYQLRLPE